MRAFAAASGHWLDDLAELRALGDAAHVSRAGCMIVL